MQVHLVYFLQGRNAVIAIFTEIEPQKNSMEFWQKFEDAQMASRFDDLLPVYDSD